MNKNGPAVAALLVLFLVVLLTGTGCEALGTGTARNARTANTTLGADEAVVGATRYRELLPANITALPEDFYAAGLTREAILARLPQAVAKTGQLCNETWSGVILVTGDLEADNLVIEPGTIVFIEANSDDQAGGGDSEVDPMNPHEFQGEDYSITHIDIRVREALTARGTAEDPIIITSTAESPGLADWDHINFQEGILEYAVVEHGWGVSIGSSDAVVSHCVIRNVLQQGLMFGTWPEAGITGTPVSPEITCNYMYNFGHMAVQSFFSEPYIAHNIFIQRNTADPELYQYLSLGENGGLDIHGGGGTIEHNFLSSGHVPDLESDGECGGPGVVITEATAPVMSYNIIAGNRWGIELQGGMPVANCNDILCNADGGLAVRYIYAETGREDKAMTYDEPIDFRSNWWGTSDEAEAMTRMNIDEGIGLDLEPVSPQRVQGAGPDWDEFAWLYT
jgi:hypothetical protein